MSFLAPLFLLGLAAIVVPVVIHLIQRERKNVVQFPSLMFLQRIPYQSVRRRRIRNWPLLLLRVAALALIVAAFARPFLRRQLPAIAATGGAREVVVLVDRSYSMGYGDRWSRAVGAATGVINSLGPADRASVVLFGSDAEVALRSASDRGRLAATLPGVKPGDSATRYGPALKLAGSIASESTLPRREVVLVSDFQRSGWAGAEGVRLPDGVALTAVSVADGQAANLTVTPVSIQRSTFSEKDRVTVTGGVVNHGDRPASDVELWLEVDGRKLQTTRLKVDANGSASFTFDPFTPAGAAERYAVRIGPDRLEADNAFYFVVSPRDPIRVIVAERGGSKRDSSLYVSRALALGDSPPFDVVIKGIDTLSAEDLQRASVVVLNDVPLAPLHAERLASFVERGGGVLVVLGDRATWPPNVPDILPVTVGTPVDRAAGPAARLGALEYGHPIFEPFRAPRSGDFSAARFYGYRAVTPVKDAQILARFDDGTPALVERRVGNGRVLAWGSTLDLQWNDLAIKPVFLPFVHRMATSLASYSERPAWVTVGEVLEPTQAAPAVTPAFAKASAGRSRVVLTPSGERLPLGGDARDVISISEKGFYEIRPQGTNAEPPLVVAANVDLSESDLTPMDPNDVAAGATGRAGGAAPAGSNTIRTGAEIERGQRGWWLLLLAGVLLLGFETLLSNRPGHVRMRI